MFDVTRSSSVAWLEKPCWFYQSHGLMQPPAKLAIHLAVVSLGILFVSIVM